MNPHMRTICSNMAKINLGKIEDGIYTKSISPSKAVLWKDRSLSLPPKVIKAIADQDVKKIVFLIPSKLEKWIFDTDKVLANMRLKTVGQEAQYYFSIDLAKRVSVESGTLINEPL